MKLINIIGDIARLVPLYYVVDFIIYIVFFCVFGYLNVQNSVMFWCIYFKNTKQMIMKIMVQINSHSFHKAIE
ncbi:MAG: hypothetical protein DSZ27_05270 [Thiomicrospira sp.]|nr:MAG: hypothetical protein DSZ27_05270 [Thiomicrospira sp.]